MKLFIPKGALFIFTIEGEKGINARKVNKLLPLGHLLAPNDFYNPIEAGTMCDGNFYYAGHLLLVDRDFNRKHPLFKRNVKWFFVRLWCRIDNLLFGKK